MSTSVLNPQDTTPAYSSHQSTTTTPATTTATRPPPSGDVRATLNFYKPSTTTGEAPYHYVHDPPPGVPKSSFATGPHEVLIRDLRGQESAFKLDTQAFQPVPSTPSSEKLFTDEAAVTSTYYDEVRKLLLDTLPGAKEVMIFDHTIRRTTPDAPRTPVFVVHVDQTHEAGYKRVQRHASADTIKEVLENGVRARIINVWRPIGGPVYKHPLALADSRSVPEDEVVSVRHIYPDHEGATMGVKFGGESQKWWYWSGMGVDDVVLIKCWDSDTVVGGGAEGKKGRTPHAAFEHPGSREEDPGRASIEVRCLVIG
ncbi:hypothetical protein L873DRAFT_1808151 [Choiromyces venosus 120613-1]|uniref:Methyltransferase n=1 Tax=Choiromyces venosus 120613-1 TaxID=1336337 RepID=A0A3N4JJU0_9PEZI|nr:hypothetical protein L873DRAFT_1808151 [Choiromyces venosus 120613-1]